MNKKLLILVVLIIFPIFLLLLNNEFGINNIPNVFESDFPKNKGGELKIEPHPLSIESLRLGEYPGSELIIEQNLAPGSNYQRYIVSYKSEGLKIFALLTIPNEEAPIGGFPAIVFNHGYIPPTQYKTTERYIAYTDAFSRNGYVLLRPDYRGHGNSEGEPTGAYGSNGYAIDVLNAFSSLQMRVDVNSEKIGMWGHSLGGFLTLRAMVVNPEIKAGVIWAGVVSSYEDLFERWTRRHSTSGSHPTNRGSWRQSLSEQFGGPNENVEFWNSLSSNSFLKDISGPIQLHHGTGDSTVPYEFSQTLEKQMIEEGKEIELYLYEGDDHNISSNFSTAADRSVKFFDDYLK